MCLDDKNKNIAYTLQLDNKEDRAAKKALKDIRDRLESIFNREKYKNDGVEDGKLLKEICLAFDEEIYKIQDENERPNTYNMKN